MRGGAEPARLSPPALAGGRRFGGRSSGSARSRTWRLGRSSPSSTSASRGFTVQPFAERTARDHDSEARRGQLTSRQASEAHSQSTRRSTCSSSPPTPTEPRTFEVALAEGDSRVIEVEPGAEVVALPPPPPPGPSPVTAGDSPSAGGGSSMRGAAYTLGGLGIVGLGLGTFFGFRDLRSGRARRRRA